MAILEKTGTLFSLVETMECGQFFNWDRVEGGYRVRAHGREFVLRQKGRDLEGSGAEAEFVRWFLALDHDPAAIRAGMPRDPRLDAAFASCGRLRLLRQDPWECLVAFLLSPVSNIPRIQRNVKDLWHRTRFEPRRLRREEDLRGLGLGFRARFLVSAAERAGAVRAGPEGLEGILGVGDKVGDCVRLFAYGDYGSFPVDTWVRRVLRRLYGVRGPDRKLRVWARERFGPWAGYAQQWLFMWSRTALKPGAASRGRGPARRAPRLS